MFGLTAAEMAELIAQVEADDGPGDEIVPVGRLMAKLIIGGVRAGDPSFTKTYDAIMARQGHPRHVRSARIYQLKALGPVPEAPDSSAAVAELINFLEGVAA